MLKNYLRVALRNLRNNKGFSVINIIGLAVGVASCITILLYVQNELSYDRFNKDAGNIYRVHFHAFFNDKDLNMALSCAPLEPTLLRDYPQVVTGTRVAYTGAPVLRYRDKAFSETKFYFVDSTFFDVFSVHFIEGNPKTALTQPNTIVITEAMAKKYFGNENPMGKILNADHRQDYMVTGVVDGFPQNAHFHFNFLVPVWSRPDSRNGLWLSNNYYTYIVLRKGTNAATFQKEMNKGLRKYIGPQLKASTGVTFDQFESSGNKLGFYLQPLTSIHLHSHLDYEISPNSDVTYVWVFSTIAIVILLIACINFMNLATARSEKRAKEVGIRKTLGSSRRRLIAQFMAESMLISLISVAISVGIVELLLPLFNGISGKSLTLGMLDSVYSIPLFVLLAVVVGALAGSYPALYLSSFLPAQVLKSEGGRGNRKSVLRSVLVISQFVVSIVLIVSTFVIYNELSFIRNKNLGFNKEQVVIVNKTDDIGAQIQSFESELGGNLAIRSVSNSTAIPGDQTGDTVFEPEGGSSRNAQDIRTIQCDYNFARTYKITMAEGRFLSREHPSDSGAIVLNQAAVKAFGLKDPVGKTLYSLPSPGQKPQPFVIIGVMKDFNYQSLHQAIRPLGIGLFQRGGFGKFVSVRIVPGNYRRTIAFLQQTWNKYADNEAFDYDFLDQDLNHLYREDIRTDRIAGVFSALAIFIACLGLLGLAAFTTEQRTKEIGIRKVLGASVPELIGLLSSEFAKWVLIANVIAWPLAYLIMDRWLQNFAYKTSINLWIFVASGLIALLIAIATVSSQAIKAATANPIRALRYE